MNDASKPKQTIVKMNDGREVAFGGARVMQRRILGLDTGKPAVAFDFLDGVTEVYEVPSHHIVYAAASGYAQKLSSYGAGKGIEGNPASIRGKMNDLRDRLENDTEWNEPQAESTAVPTTSSLTVKAIMELRGWTVEQVGERVAALMTKHGQTRQAVYAKLREAKDLQPILRRLEAEEAARKAAKAAEKGETEVSGDDLLSEV